jgi:hypothetical protein
MQNLLATNEGCITETIDTFQRTATKETNGKFPKVPIVFLCLSVVGATSMPYLNHLSQTQNKNSLT